MKLIKVAAGVVNQTPLAWDENKRNILAAIDEARRQDVSILCLPELCIRPPQHLLYRLPVSYVYPFHRLLRELRWKRPHCKNCALSDRLD